MDSKYSPTNNPISNPVNNSTNNPTNNSAKISYKIKDEPFYYKQNQHVIKKIELYIGFLKRSYSVYYMNRPEQFIRYWPIIFQSLDNSKTKVVAFDTERDIKKSRNYPYKLSRVRIMSICTHDLCFVISFSGTDGYGITHKYPHDIGSRYILPKQISELLSSKVVIKTGISLEEEELHLDGTFVNEDGSPVKLFTQYDLQTRNYIKNGEDRFAGLQTMCKQKFGITISKDEQIETWGENEITDQQIIYSALDSIYCYILKDEI